MLDKQNAISRIPKISSSHALCYCLVDDYMYFINLRDKFRDKIEIRNLAGIFSETFEEIKSPFIELIAKINKKHDSLEWWGGQIASRNTASTPLLLNITYLFCAKKILARADKNIVFIVESQALAGCISDMATKAGYKVINSVCWTTKYLEVLKLKLYHIAQVIYFFLQTIRHRRAAFKLLNPIPIKKSSKKRIVIRSWVTRGNFDMNGKFTDRNFGILPSWLRERNYEVLILPMFFNISMTIKELYTLMREQEEAFLIPAHYLKLSDYIKALLNGWKSLRRRINNAKMIDIDVSAIFNEVLKKLGLDPALTILNLSYPMLERLREKGFEIDAFYYAFENNPPEKPFILGCRKFFPDSKVIAFQHTTYFPNQLAYHLAPGEDRYHPLPDKIVCSGRIYKEMFEGAGFPTEILASGPNLRFESVHSNGNSNNNACISVKKLLLPLPGLSDYKLNFELFYKVHHALSGMDGYRIYIRTHPVLSRSVIIKFLNEIKMSSYEFADEGIIQDWLPKMHAVISIGTSITILEAVTMGVPVIRVIPDNTVYYDPFIWSDYPLSPVNTAEEIRKQLRLVDEIMTADAGEFHKIGKNVLSQYFTEPSDEKLRVFL